MQSTDENSSADLIRKKDPEDYDVVILAEALSHSKLVGMPLALRSAFGLQPMLIEGCHCSRFDSDLESHYKTQKRRVYENARFSHRFTKHDQVWEYTCCRAEHRLP